MRFSRKDTLGLALAAGAVVLLVGHGREPHVPRPTPAPEVVTGTASHGTEANDDVVAFVDVLLPGTAHSASRTGVVVVRGGVVSAVGSEDAVHVPAEAWIVDGEGSEFLVATPDPSGWTPVREGVAAELVLLGSDPRLGVDAATVGGRLLGGRWIPARGKARTPGVPAGH